MRSKGIDIPLTPTAQLEIMPEEELILAETVADVPAVAVAETRKKTTQKQLITMSMVPRRTRRKTTSKRKTPTSKQRTPSKRKTPTPTSKRSYDMRTIRTYNTRKRTQATETQAGLD